MWPADETKKNFAQIFIILVEFGFELKIIYTDSLAKSLGSL